MSYTTQLILPEDRHLYAPKGVYGPPKPDFNGNIIPSPNGNYHVCYSILYDNVILFTVHEKGKAILSFLEKCSIADVQIFWLTGIIPNSINTIIAFYIAPGRYGTVTIFPTTSQMMLGKEYKHYYNPFDKKYSAQHFALNEFSKTISYKNKTDGFEWVCVWVSPDGNKIAVEGLLPPDKTGDCQYRLVLYRVRESGLEFIKEYGFNILTLWWDKSGDMLFRTKCYYSTILQEFVADVKHGYETEFRFNFDTQNLRVLHLEYDGENDE